MTESHLATPPGLAAVAPDHVATHAHLRAAGVSAGMIANRCRPGGPWQRLAPGVVLLGSAPPTRRQLVRAAVACAGPDAVVTGLDALQAHGLAVPTPRAVTLLVPPHRRLSARSLLALTERTSRLPAPVLRDGLPFAPPVRAALDFARTARDPALLSAVLALVCELGHGSAADLLRELDAGNQRGSASVRRALASMDGMLKAALHGRAHLLIRDTHLPPPRWNVVVRDRRRKPIAQVDAWWDVGLAWLLDSEDRPCSVTTRLALAAAGIVVVTTPAAVLTDHPDRLAGARVLRELTSGLLDAARRPRPPVLTDPRKPATAITA